MGKSSGPSPPDYTGAAQAQGQANLQATALAGGLNRPTVTTPYGTQTWSNPAYQQALAAYKAGGSKGPAPNLLDYSQPGQLQENIQFSPDQQARFAQSQQISDALGNQSLTSLGQVRSSLGQPIDYSKLPNATQGADAIRQSVVDSLYKQQTQYLDPQFQQQQSMLDTQLRNQGLQPGSQAYDTAMANLGRQKQQAYGNAMYNAIGQGTSASEAAQRENIAAAQQGISEQELARELPLNELNALRTGAQTSLPNFQATQPYSAPQAAPLFGATEAQYQAGLGQANAGNAMAGNIFGGLTQLGSSFISSYF